MITDYFAVVDVVGDFVVPFVTQFPSRHRNTLLVRHLGTSHRN